MPSTPQNSAHRTRDLALVASFAALIAACSVLPAVQLGPAPLTLQTFAVFFTGAALGARRGFLAALLYLCVGALGIPVFSGGAAGIAPFAGPTVGYLISFPLAAWLTGLLVERLPRTRSTPGFVTIAVAALLASTAFLRTLGPLGLMLRANLSPGEAFAVDLVFWPGDLAKILLAAVVAAAVHRAFPTLLPERRQRSQQ